MAEEQSESGPPGVKTDKKTRRIFTRRRVLTGGGFVLAAGALGAGGFLVYDHQLRFGREPMTTIPDHRVLLPSTVPKMVVARGADPAASVSACLTEMGGMSRFIGPDDVVVVKPNIGWNRTMQQAANTHPDVVSQVVRECLDCKPKRLIVSDCPVSKARDAFERSGISKAAKEAGAEVILPEESVYHTVKISERLGTWDVLEPFVIATKIINVPIAKHHSMTGVTSGMKNWIGITGKLRVMFHDGIQQSIAELAALMRPTLTVVDATRVLMESGPQGGSLSHVKEVGAVAVSADPVAAEAWSFDIFGIEAQDYPESLTLAEAMGLGTKDFSSLNPVELVL